MTSVVKNIIINSKAFKAYQERKIKKIEKARFLKEADQWLDSLKVDDSEKKEIRRQFINSMNKYMFSFNEFYFQYDLYGKKESAQREYLSRSRAQKYYRSIMHSEWRNTFHDKSVFLNKFNEFVHRKFMIVDNSVSTQDVCDMLATAPCIVKPLSGSLGAGIFKVLPEEMNDGKRKEEILDKIFATKSIIEECVEGHPEIQKFHPQSLNTIRVVTVRAKGGGISLLGSFIRLGTGGAIVDNAHAGGIFAHIDTNTGAIDSDGNTTTGHIFLQHPDTNCRIKGFKIPNWEDISQACIKSHEKSDTFIIGWDVVVNKDGKVEFIEGNHAPDVDVMQGTIKKGIRTEFENAFKAFGK